jgi:hypothetical protein
MEVDVIKNRIKQRENRKIKKDYMDKYLENKIKDLTPYNADRLMKGGSINDIVLK